MNKYNFIFTLLIGTLLPTACNSNSDNPDPYGSLEVNLDKALILELINNHRAEGVTCGNQEREAVAPLVWNDQLAQAALDHSNDMQQNDYFSHTGLDGSSHGQRAKRAGYTGSPVSENIASGQRSEERVVEAWMQSEGHCKAIMREGITEIAIARSNEGNYWTLLTGKGSDQSQQILTHTTVVSSESD
ncbi:MAG: CAP domain-containing protein [Thermonemataceae bacterium]